MAVIAVTHIRKDAADEALWDTYVAGHPDATCYHAAAWRRIFERSFGYRSWYLLARRGAAGPAAGCLPLFRVASPMGCRLVAVPFRDRGGPLWDDAEALDALLAEACRLRERTGAGFLLLKSLQALPPGAVERHGLRERRYWVRSEVDLRGLTSEAVAKKVGPKSRNMVRQAERAGLAFEEADPPASAVRDWYRLHLATQKDLGLPPFPLKYFRNLLVGLEPSGGARLFLVRRGRDAVAGTIVLVRGRTAIYGYSASRIAAQALRPNDFMLFHAMARLIEGGFTTFDLGSDAPGQQGLLFFKRKWLARQEPVPYYTSGDADDAASDSSDPRYALLRKGFRRLPTAALRAMGGMTKYFG